MGDSSAIVKGAHSHTKKQGECMHLNNSSEELITMSEERGESILLKTGALATETGFYRGRAADAKFYVKDELTVDSIDWASNNSITEDEFSKMFAEFRDYKEKLPDFFCQEVSAVRDPRHRLDVVVYTEMAKHALFARNMFIPGGRPLVQGADPFFIYHFPNKQDEAQVVISMKERVILITGSHYSGEIKKSVFSVLNFLFPQAGHLPMHCSVNVDINGANPAIFFGLSGTGKTTLSSDEKRILIGDDEHGWTSFGLTNFENGCYAKTINLSKEAEPQIWDACNKHGALLENVTFHPGTMMPDFSDSALTENTRASYPCSSIAAADESGYVDLHPKNIVMLTCDAFGVLPAVMKLSPEEAVRQFVLGYTAKVAGTEAGVTEPKATFSACFGAPFMPLPVSEYAELLRQKIVEHGTDCWLVNTGWTGGGYGVGSRMPISATRSIIDKIHDGTLAKSPTLHHTPTGFEVPVVEGIDESFLAPELSWASIEEYASKARELMGLFKQQEDKNN